MNPKINIESIEIFPDGDFGLTFPEGISPQEKNELKEFFSRYVISKAKVKEVIDKTRKKFLK